MEDDKRKFLSESVGMPLQMVLVRADQDRKEQEAGTAAGPRKSNEEREKEAAVLRLIEHLNRKP